MWTRPWCDDGRFANVLFVNALFICRIPRLWASRFNRLSIQRSRALSACAVFLFSALSVRLIRGIVCAALGLASFCALAQISSSTEGVSRDDLITAQTPKPEEALKAARLLQLEELRAKRDEIEKTYEQKNAACLKKFAVTGCKIDALNEKNTLLGSIKKQEAQLNEQQKSLQSEQKLKDIAERHSPEEQERANERAQRAQQAFDERSTAHAVRLAEHERQLNAERASEKVLSPEKKALARAAGAQSSQELYDQKIKAAADHREELRKRVESKTLHPAPLPLPGSVQTPKGSSPL
jgi:hypothetical protein